jgi:hypothetical protein
VSAGDTTNADTANVEENEIVGKYLTASKLQEEALKGVQMEMQITAKLPKQAKQGSLTALRIISRVGKISYDAIRFLGDNDVKKQVIARYLDAETQARESGSIAITPVNYKFKLKQKIKQDGQQIYVFQLTPKKPYRVGEFKGELRIDGATGMPLQESGQLVKNPSIFLKKVIFERDYALQDGVAIPARIQSTVDARFVGTAELNISFTNYTHQEADQAIAHDPSDR